MAITNLQPISVRDLSGGMVSNVSSILLPDNACPLSVNFNYDFLGSAKQRNGTTLLGSTVSSGTCTGLGQFINGAGTINRLIAVFGNTMWAYDGSNWTNVGTTAVGKTRFASLGDYIYKVGVGGTTQSWNGVGGTFSNTNLTGAPNGEVIMAYKQRLYIAGDITYPDRLYFSDILSLTKTLSWDNSVNYLDINPDDSDNISALAKISNLLLIFKERAMYRWNGSSTDAEIVVDIGTTSQESVAQCKGMVFFFNPQGIFATDGGYPVEISRPVYDWIKNMSASRYHDVGAFCDDDHYYCSIGNVTKDGRTFNNVWLCYTVSSKNWFVHSFYNDFRVMSKYIKSDNSVTYVGGDTAGAVQTLFSGTTDNNNPIYWEYETKDIEMGSRANVKALQDIAIFMSSGLGGTVAITSEGKSYNSVGRISDNVTYLHDVGQQGRYMRLKVYGSNRFAPVVFDGFELLETQNLGPVPHR